MSDPIPYLIHDLGRQYRDCFQSMTREFSASTLQLRLMFTINRNPGASQGFLADALEIEPMTLCRMIDRLEETGIVTRKRNPNDRRAWSLFLTDLGQEKFQQLVPISENLTEIAVAGIASHELEQFRGTLERMRLNLSKHQLQLAIETGADTEPERSANDR